MGLFDTVKLKANLLAADAERAGKVTAAQARTVVLQNDIRKAERELGHAAFSLIESGGLMHPDLEAAAARLRDARQALGDKEAEIEALRHGEPAEPADASPVTSAAADASPVTSAAADAPPEASLASAPEPAPEDAAGPPPEPAAQPAAAHADAPAPEASETPAPGASADEPPGADS